MNTKKMVYIGGVRGEGGKYDDLSYGSLCPEYFSNTKSDFLKHKENTRQKSVIPIL